MRNSHRLLAKTIFLGSVFWLTSDALAATPAGGLVFDPTNFVKNAITASETVKQTMEQVNANMLHLQQLEELVKSRAKLTAAALALVGGASNLAEVQQRIADVKSLQQSLGTLQNDLKTMKSRFDMRMTAAQLMGMTLEVYYTKMKQKAKTDAEKIQAGVVADQKALESVNKAHSQVRTWTESIKGIDSQVAGLSVLGSQMNVLVAQNAELMSYLVRDKTEQRDAAKEALKEANERLQADEARLQASKDAYEKSKKDLQEEIKKSPRLSQ